MSKEYKKVLEYLERYGGEQYKKLEKCKNDSEKQYMMDAAEAGKEARELFSSIAKIIENKTGFILGRITQWQNSGTFVSYFWTQLKREAYVDSNISLSFFAEKVESTYRFRLSIELADEKSTQDERVRFEKLQDIPLESGLVYVAGGNNNGKFEVLAEKDNEVIKLQKHKKIQVSHIISEIDEDSVFLDDVIDNSKKLVRYYDYVQGEKSDVINNNDETVVWWPSLDEYNPEISKEQWLEMLGDGKTFTDNAYFAIAAMYDFGGVATCRQLEERYGKTSDFYRNCLGTQLASKVKQKYDLPYCMKGEENSKVWPIVFQGRNATTTEPGNYVWKIRTELFEALTEFGIEKYLIKEEGEEKLSTKDTIEQIKKYIASKGFSYNNDLIENFYLSLKSKPFVILAGTSGTGKTKLVKLFAEAIGAKYKLVSVRPDWSDSSDLFGHTNLKGEFVKGAITEYVKDAQMHQEYPYFLCMDEMNLARVEYYLSDFLSLIETRKWEGEKVVTEPIELDQAAEKEFKGLYLPENLYIIGTVNMDETTFPFSKKVLDRANTIEFSYVDLIPDFDEAADKVYPIPQNNTFLKTEFLNLKADVKDNQKEMAAKVCEELQNVNEILQDANAHVGYRVRDEIVFYMINNEEAELLSYEDALDNEIMQKILPRIQGSSAGVKELLCKLFKKFAGDYSSFSQELIWKQMDSYIKEKDCTYKNSATKICYMMRRYEEDGFTSYWL